MYDHIYMYICSCIQIYVYTHSYGSIHLVFSFRPCTSESFPPGPYGPPWALMGQALMGSLGP